MDLHTYDLKKMSALPRLSSKNPNHIYLITQWMQTTSMVELIYRSLEKCSSPTIVKWLCFHSVCLLCAFGSRCPDDLTKKYWCHANNILQIHRWGCVVLQVMHHVLVTLLMTPPRPSQQLCQISKLPKHFSWCHQVLVSATISVSKIFRGPICLPCWVVTKLKVSLDLTAGS